MVIIGVAVLAGCYLVGQALGELLGLALGVDANVGGVGFAMVLFVVVSDQLRRRGRFPATTEMGVLFWSALYIPIVVAMAATQNVVSALSGGPMALLVGVAATAAGLALVRPIAKIGGSVEPLPPLDRDASDLDVAQREADQAHERTGTQESSEDSARASATESAASTTQQSKRENV